MPKGYHHLTYEERCQIYALKQRGDSLKQIATQLGVNKSTISQRDSKKFLECEAIGTNKQKRVQQSVEK